MPTAHSKRNTALAFFTSYERSLLKAAWGSRKTRLNRDSFLQFGSCNLCLIAARDAVACFQGHVFCRECALSNILAQKQEIARLEKEWERRKKDDQLGKQLEAEQSHGRDVKDFELVQLGFQADKSSSSKRKAVDEESTSAKLSKRKLDGGDAETADTPGKAVESSFWMPSQVPSADSKPVEEKPPKLQTLCPCSSESASHPYSLKTLTAINFTNDDRQSGAKSPQNHHRQSETYLCPACSKHLSNTTKAVMAIPCGHVLCKPCADKFLKKPDPDPHHRHTAAHLTCYVCNKSLEASESSSSKKKSSTKASDKAQPGLVDLKYEGTGFAGGGQAEVEKFGVAFQC